MRFTRQSKFSSERHEIFGAFTRRITELWQPTGKVSSEFKKKFWGVFFCFSVFVRDLQEMHFFADFLPAVNKWAEWDGQFSRVRICPRVTSFRYLESGNGKMASDVLNCTIDVNFCHKIIARGFAVRVSTVEAMAALKDANGNKYDSNEHSDRRYGRRQAELVVTYIGQQPC